MGAFPGFASRFAKRPGPTGGRVVLFTLLSLLYACSATPIVSPTVRQLAPLHTAQGELSVEQAVELAPTPDLLALDDDMRAFVQRYTGGVVNERQRLYMLQRSLLGAGSLDLQYDPLADGTAMEVFHRGSANCLSYANLFVALAREANLDARYQWLELRPQWGRVGDRVALRLHVNALVELRRGEQFMVDLDPQPSREVTGAQGLADRDAQALYHNNLAMDALSREELEMAWAHLVRALSLSPRMSQLWVNLGAVYRMSGQYRPAEESYLHALELDSGDHSAMNNLAVLYGIEGRGDEQRHWLAHIERYRQSNPYYHAWLGDRAGELGNWREALGHYKRALRLLPEDSHLLYARGLIHYELGESRLAAEYIERAIAKATLSSDRMIYQQRLEGIKREASAGA